MNKKKFTIQNIIVSESEANFSLSYVDSDGFKIANAKCSVEKNGDRELFIVSHPFSQTISPEVLHPMLKELSDVVHSTKRTPQKFVAISKERYAQQGV